MRSDKKYSIEQKKMFFLKYLIKIFGIFNFCLLQTLNYFHTLTHNLEYIYLFLKSAL